MPIDTLALRRTFSRFGTGITVVTTCSPEGRRLGLTVNSFNTVSLSPPIVLWSLAAASASLSGFRQSGRFVVNVLALDQLELAQRFARPSPVDRFAGVDCETGLHGQPVLAGCAATIECRIVGEQPVGDHVLFLGEVERHAHAHHAPLLFCNGHYQQGVSVAAAASQPLSTGATKGHP